MCASSLVTLFFAHTDNQIAFCIHSFNLTKHLFIYEIQFYYTYIHLARIYDATPTNQPNIALVEARAKSS